MTPGVLPARVWTSAGITAGIDLCLALVEEGHARSIAIAELALTGTGIERKTGGVTPKFETLVEAHFAGKGTAKWEGNESVGIRRHSAEWLLSD